MTKEDKKHYRKTNTCWFGEKDVGSSKIRDHCHLPVNYRDTGHEKCNKMLNRKKNNFFHQHSVSSVSNIVISSSKI